MVRHGTLKKRRSGRKVTRKAPKHKAVKIRNAISDMSIREQWDHTKSTKENFLSMGLAPNPNQATPDPDQITGTKSGFMGFMKLPTAVIEDTNPRRRNMSDSDQEYLILCLNKHGVNFKKMSFDIKLNHLQITETKLRKMYEKFLSISDEERIKTPVLRADLLNTSVAKE